MYKVYELSDVKNFYLHKSAMSPKKLQKILYFAYAWTLAIFNDDENDLNNKLFKERFQAWVHGPVISSLYGEYKHLGWNDIEKVESFDDSMFGEDLKEVLNQVWDCYGKYSGSQLENITHQEDPWINARRGLSPSDPCGSYISDKDIFRYYTAMASQ